MHFVTSFRPQKMEKVIMIRILKYLEPEAVTRTCSVKNILLKISQNSQENTCLQLNKFKEGPSFDPIYQVSCFSSLGDASCFHVFPGKGHLSLPAQGKKIMFSGKNTIFTDNTRRTMRRRVPFWKDHLFRRPEGNIIFPCIF